jgi:hypothetical protein
LHKEPLLQNTFSDVSKSQPFLSFGRLTFFSSEQVASEISKSQFLTLDIDFVRKVDAVTQKIRMSPTLSASGMRGPRKFAFHLAFVRRTPPQWVARLQDKFAFHHTFVRRTRTISAEGHVPMNTAGLPLPPRERI